MPFDFKASLGWAKSHPWATGGIVFIVGIGAILLLGRQGGGGSDSGGSANLGAYLAAQTAQNQNDNATTAYLAKLKGDSEFATITGKTQSDIAKTYADMTADTNLSTQKLGLIDALAKIANNLGTVLTSTKATQSGSGGGLNLGFGSFGFGFNSNKSSANAQSSQTLVANSQQELAATTLSQISQSLFNPMN